MSEKQYKFDEKKHAHTLDGAPLIGTSSMSSVLAKGGLTWWASGLACEKFGWTNKGNAKTGWTPKNKRIDASVKRHAEIVGMSPEEYLTLLDDAYSAHNTKLSTSAVAGTDMHEVMETYVKACLETNKGIPLAHAPNEDKKLSIFVDWSMKNVKRFLWSEIHCYSEKLWLGGISDAGFEDKDGKYGVLDFKSSKEVYLSQFWQCIGYAMQIEENGGFTKDGEKMFKLDRPIDYVAVLPFGMENPEVQCNYDMSGGKDAVQCMLTLYKKLN